MCSCTHEGICRMHVYVATYRQRVAESLVPRVKLSSPQCPAYTAQCSMCQCASVQVPLGGMRPIALRPAGAAVRVVEGPLRGTGPVWGTGYVPPVYAPLCPHALCP